MAGPRTLAALLVLAACGTDPPPPGERPDALWSEFLDDGEVEAQLPWVAAQGADLYLAVRQDRIGDAGLASLIRACDGGVRIWLLLSDEDGYWPNEHNVAATRDAVMRLADWRDAEQLPFDWVTFDLEMSLERTREIADLIATEGAIAAVDAMKAGRDPDAFVAHKAEMTALVADVQARGLRVAAVTYPMVLDDGGDGDTDIEDELDVPVFDVGYDEVSFMVYQSLLYDLSGEWHDEDVIYSYATTARELLGDRAAIALGIVGSVGIEPVAMPYPDADALVADRAAARGAGVDRVSVYSLDGMIEQSSPDAWMVQAPPTEPRGTDGEFLRQLVVGLLDG